MRVVIQLLLILSLISCKKDKQQSTTSTKNQYLDQAFSYNKLGKTDSALSNFYKAKTHLQNKKDTFGIAQSLVNIASILIEKGDFYGGQETSLDALQYLKKQTPENEPLLFSNYSNLGNANFSYGDYNKAIEFYDLALKYVQNKSQLKLTLNAKGNSFRDLNEYDKALSIYHQALTADNTKDKNWARVLNNQARTKWLKDKTYNPEADYQISLEVCEKNKDYFLQYLTHFHLTEYYKETHQDSKALYHARKMYEASIKCKKPDARCKSLKNLSILEKDTEAKEYFKAYIMLSDSLNTTRNLAKSQHALFRFEYEQNKINYLKAKAENTSKKNQIIIQYSVTTILLISLISGAAWLMRRQKRLKKEKELELQKTRLDYSKKVHDNVANKIYHLISEIEYNVMLDREDILDKLEPIYETSRNISYDFQQNAEGQNFHVSLSQTLKSYSSPNTQIFIVGNEDFIWQDFDLHQKDEILAILQEIMTNMKKHSNATAVSIKFFKKLHELKIDYHDNGIGISHYKAKNGITNVLSRVSDLRGTIDFKTDVPSGLDISISLPI